MKISILAHGTRGDVQPFLGLAHALRERGHAASVAAPPNLVEFVRRAGVPHRELALDSEAVMASERGQQWLASGDVRSFFKALGDITRACGDDLNRKTIEACEGADVIIGNVLMDDWGVAVAEKLRVPFLLACTMPLLETGSYANPLVTTGRVPTRTLRKLTHRLYAGEAWKSRRDVISKLRTQLGLRAVDSPWIRRTLAQRGPTLHMWSEQLLARPDDWGDEHAVTGFWNLPSALRANLGEAVPPAGLPEWLDAGPAPYYLGFGSMPIRDPAALLQTVREVLDELGARGVVCAGWNAIEPALARSASMFLVKSVDHSWLFPRCAGVVHHGGAGTTAATATAGVPALVCSVFADQPFWGARVRALGLGAHVPFRKLEKKSLRAGLEQLRDAEVRARAAALGERLRGEDGLAAAVRQLEAWLPRAPSPLA